MADATQTNPLAHTVPPAQTDPGPGDANSPATLLDLLRCARSLVLTSEDLLHYIHSNPTAFDCRIIEARHYKSAGSTPHEFLILTLRSSDLVCGLRFDRRAVMGGDPYTQSFQMVKVGSSSLEAMDVINGFKLLPGHTISSPPNESDRLVVKQPWSAGLDKDKQGDSLTLKELAELVQPIYEVLGAYSMYDSNCWALARLVLFFSTRSLRKVLFDKKTSHRLGLKPILTSSIRRVHHGGNDYTLISIAEVNKKDKPLATALFSLEPARPHKIPINSTDLGKLEGRLDKQSWKIEFYMDRNWVMDTVEPTFWEGVLVKDTAVNHGLASLLLGRILAIWEEKMDEVKVDDVKSFGGWISA